MKIPQFIAKLKSRPYFLHILSLTTVFVCLCLTITLFESKHLFDFRSRAALPENAVSIADFDATPNDDTDDTTAIKNAITAAKTEGKIVYVPSGTFIFTSFVLDGVQMIGEGEGSVLQAKDSLNATIFLRGDAPSLTSVMVKNNAQVRYGTNKHAIWADFATNYVVSHVTVDGAADAGIFSYGSSNGRITDNVVKNTMADGIHNTNGAHDLYIARNTVTNVGDDMIAVVGYNNKGDCLVSTPYNILIEYNNVYSQTRGRGITVVGGRDVTIRSNSISRSSGAGLYITSESSWNTCSDDNILVEKNTIDITNANGIVDHPAVLIYANSTNQIVQRVLLSENIIKNTPSKAAVQIRPASTNIALINNTITNTASGISKTTTGNVYCEGNTFNGTANPATSCGGSYSFSVTGSTMVGEPAPSVLPIPPVIPVVSGVNNASCIFTSFPTTFIVGESKSVSFTMKNTGTATWLPEILDRGVVNTQPYRLGTTDRIWKSAGDVGRAKLITSVPPGGSFSFLFPVKAPTTPGTYSAQWQMLKEGVQWFGPKCGFVTVMVNAAPTPTPIPTTPTPTPKPTATPTPKPTATPTPAPTLTPGDFASCVNTTIPASFTINESKTVSVTMRNSGTAIWYPDGVTNPHRLGALNDNKIWKSEPRVRLTTSVAPGANYTFSFTMKAPATAGTYLAQWKMLKEGVHWFGNTCGPTTVQVTN